MKNLVIMLKMMIMYDTIQHYVGFKIVKYNPTATAIYGTDAFDYVVNATIIATPIKPNFTPWLLGTVGANRSTAPPQVTGITDNKGFATLPMESIFQYNVILQRENQPDKCFSLFPEGDYYTVQFAERSDL